MKLHPSPLDEVTHRWIGQGPFNHWSIPLPTVNSSTSPAGATQSLKTHTFTLAGEELVRAVLTSGEIVLAARNT